jgi:NAD(P)-dependent dehydrogenase (short-subunit alcohol dehydrogenase family)
VDAERHAGRRAIVTGAASGIGYATAARLVREGAQVTACDMNEAGLRALEDELGAHDRVRTLVADITIQGDVDAVVVLATADGPVDILANVAGIMDFFVPIHDIIDEEWERVFAVNVTGAMRLCRSVVPAMRAANRGAIVNVASRAALLGGGAGTAYVASKHALLGLTRSVAALYGAGGIRCNAVCPGAVETGIASTATPRNPEHIAPWMPLFSAATRTAKPDEIAAVVSWLASDEASNVNGAAVTADGGWSAI